MARLPHPLTSADFAAALAAALDGFVLSDTGMPDALDRALADVASSLGEERVVAIRRARELWAALDPDDPRIGE